MRKLIHSLMLLALSDASIGQPHVQGLETSTDLGHGFWLVTLAQKVTGGFESIGHFRHCYYNERDLGQCNLLSPAPSGDLAVFQESASGNIFLFTTSSGTSTKLTDAFPGLMQSASWDSKASQVTVSVGPYGKERSISFSYAPLPGT